MKIDIHAHTKKIKSGDSDNRNINVESFVKIIKATDVKILAITNHNHFDIKQYHEFVQETEGICQIWPGVELDIFEDGRRGHLLIIVNPKNAQLLFEKMNKLLLETTEEKFKISIDDTIKCFDEIESIYIPHYFVKKPNLTDADIEKISNLVSNKNRVIKEATNSISAGIYISHGHKSIYGSDVHNWDDYVKISEELPELRLPVESFEQFCLLLEKDKPTIDTLLDQKKHEQISIEPFGPEEIISLNIFNDINILFGSKGTGKTEILRAISRHYNASGLKTHVYESSSENLDGFFDIKGTDLIVELVDINIDNCSAEISYLKCATEESITSLSNYTKFYKSQITNERANAISIKDFSIQDIANVDRKLNDVIEVYNEVNKFIEFVSSNDTFKHIISIDLLYDLDNILKLISEQIDQERENRFANSKATQMFNDLIKIFIDEIAKKTGKPSKPITTGFQKYASNRIRIERSVNKINENMKKKIQPQSEYVGNLGGKGKLYCKTDIVVQDGTISDSRFNTLKKISKTPQKEFSKQIITISKNLYTNYLFEEITEFLTITGIENIKDIDDLILFRRYFAINNEPYTPSNGESSMLLLHKELSEDKDIYFIDEPEKSLGNDYINDVIVPLLKERAKMGKKVIIATHDANIAVRTLPYNSIYRKHEMNSYSTYIGNPFSNNLVSISDTTDLLNWKDISMKTLEGGSEAFGERGKIYGHS